MINWKIIFIIVILLVLIVVGICLFKFDFGQNAMDALSIYEPI